MKKLVLSLLSLAAIIFVGYVCYYNGAPLAAWRMQWEVYLSGPSIGATQGEVEAWIDARGIYHDFSNDLDSVGDYPAEASFRSVGGLSPHDSGFVVYGRGEVWVYFFFGLDGRLCKTAVRYWPGYF